jgi:hypothetical protein
MEGNRAGPRRGAQAAVAMVAAMIVGAGVAPAALAAVPTDLFFSEYVEGTAPGNDALEIFNGTGQGVNLQANGYVVDIYLDGGAAPLSASLSGVLASGDVYVLTNPNANAAILGVADQTVGVVDFSGNDTIVLRKGATVLDVIGQIGNNPGANGWGVDPTNTVDNTLRRLSSITAGDTVSNDPFDPAAQWAGFPADTFGGLGAHTIDADPGGGASGVVSAQVSVAAAAACLQLSTGSVDFGTLPLEAADQAATPNVTITNCSTAGETLLASGTNATGAGASWNLVDNAATCASALGTNNYHLSVESPPQVPQTQLATTNKTIQTLTAAQAVAHTIRIDTACPGSSGAGLTMTMSINYLVTP